MKSAAYYDGAFIELDEYAVQMEDRGWQLGDGVFETIRIYGGRCFALPEHIERYRRSMRALQIPITDTDEELAGVFYELIEKSGISDGLIYFQLTRSTSPRSYAFPERPTPHLAVIIRDTPVDAEAESEGIRAALVEDIRWLRCDVLSLNLLGSVLAAEEARRKYAKKALLWRKEKNVITECHDANFFIVKDGVLWTHPADNHIVKGITRSLVVERLAPALDLVVVEKAFTPEFLEKADEAFATSTTDEIVPVTSVGRSPVGDGTVGEVTMALARAFRDFVTGHG